MAMTRLISMYKTKGKSVADCISDRIDYAFYECDPKAVRGEFIL